MIFLNLFMPEFDGAELLRRIRQMDEHMPMIIITVYSDSDLMKRPFDSDDILNAVRSFTKSTAARE